jgi:Leucine-rich repeat (LRR) protein
MRYFGSLFISTLAFIGLLSACMPTGQNPRAAFERGAAALAACAETKCDRLNLDGSRLKDFTVLNDMTHITALMVSYSNFDDLADIAGMTQLTELHISNTRVDDLSGLGQFPNLTVLHASFLQNTPDPSFVSSLTNLQELVIGAKAEDDLHYLAPLKKLKALRIDNGQVTDLSVLLTLGRLEELTIYAGLPTDVGPILEIKRLKQLMIRNEYLTPEFYEALKRKKGVAIILEPVVVC